jgi:hypothetical protein
MIRGSTAPRAFRLFEPREDGWILHFEQGMQGRLVLPSGITELAALATPQNSVGARGYRIRLDPECRGKVVVGDSAILFQFVPAPPAQPRPQLPASLVRGTASVDWATTIIAAASFLAHFFLIGAAYSDFLDDVVDDDLRVASLIDSVVPAPAPVVETPPETSEKASEAKVVEPAHRAERDRDRGTARATRPASSPSRETAALTEALGTVMETIGVLRRAGSSTEGVLTKGEVPTTILDEAARSATGVGLHLIGEAGSDRVHPGEHGSLADLGNDRSAVGHDAGKAGAAPAGPHGTVEPGHPETVGGRIPNAAAVVASLRAGFRACYNRTLAQDPDAQGKIALSLQVGANGEVTSVTANPSGAIPGALVSCIRARARAAVFDPPAGGMAVVQVPVSLVKQ